jgi:hypothetical protein
VQVVEYDRGQQVGAGADGHDPRAMGGGERVVQPGGEGEVAQEVRGELHFPALAGALELRERHDAGVVDQDVQRLVPGSGEAADGVLVGQVQGAHRDLVLDRVHQGRHTVGQWDYSDICFCLAEVFMSP